MTSHKKHKRTRKRGHHCLCAVLCLFVAGKIHAERIEAVLGKGEAWMGEGVPLYVMLEAPGPFSGTASFDLPEIPGTFFIKQGSPTVGSKTVAGETVMTQRHEFRIYTQQSGTIQIPAIAVRYEAKPGFVSDPEPHEGTTVPIQFVSKQPPETRRGDIVLTVADMDISQEWKHIPEEGPGEAGMVVERTIVRRARNTTAMLFQPLEETAPDGVRIYTAVPSVIDKSERGTIVAERVDQIKYQFTHGGDFVLPELEFVWWDGKKLQREVLQGVRMEIASMAKPEQKPGFVTFIPGIGGLLAGWLLGRRLKKKLDPLNHGKNRTAKLIAEACQANNPDKAYALLLAWQPEQFHEGLMKEWRSLSTHLYSINGGTWDGTQLLRQFKKEYRLRNKLMCKRKNKVLAPLNPLGG